MSICFVLTSSRSLVLELCTCCEQTKQKNTLKMSNRQLENASDDDLDFCL